MNPGERQVKPGWLNWAPPMAVHPNRGWVLRLMPCGSAGWDPKPFPAPMGGSGVCWLCCGLGLYPERGEGWAASAPSAAPSSPGRVLCREHSLGCERCRLLGCSACLVRGFPERLFSLPLVQLGRKLGEKENSSYLRDVEIGRKLR